jgi:hypothetical protein
MEQIYNAIQAAAEQNPHGFRDSIEAALADKIQDALELKKIEIASGMFGAQQIEASEETGSDEDVQATA